MVIDGDGEPVFLSQGGSANLATTCEFTLVRSLQRALEGVPEVTATCACFAGLMTDESREEALHLVTPLVKSERFRIEPDYAAALRACPEGTDICIIAGTGSVICSRTETGLVKSGGGGYLLGDEGSGFQYGRAALAHYIRDPAGSSDALRSAVKCLFDTTEPNRVVERVYAANAPAPLMAGLATALMKDAQDRRPYAMEVIATQSELLAQLAASHLSTHHPDKSEPLFGLAGGLWKRGAFRDSFTSALVNLIPQATAHKSEMPPVRGAALLARELL